MIKRRSLLKTAAITAIAGNSMPSMASVLTSNHPAASLRLGQLIMENRLLSSSEVSLWLEKFNQNQADANWLKKSIIEDRNKGDLVWVNGWVMSRTEACYQACKYLSGP